VLTLMSCCVLLQGWDTFGSRYIMQIPDTVVGAVEGLTEGSEEFLVFDKVLLAEAARVGLHPVSALPLGLIAGLLLWAPG
jgi:hypothetical protein